MQECLNVVIHSGRVCDGVVKCQCDSQAQAHGPGIALGIPLPVVGPATFFLGDRRD